MINNIKLLIVHLLLFAACLSTTGLHAQTGNISTRIGNLTIAGVTKPITLEVSWTMHEDNTITCSGIQKLKMTDYQVQPPGFLAIMKTGDEITLDFKLEFKS